MSPPRRAFALVVTAATVSALTLTACGSSTRLARTSTGSLASSTTLSAHTAPSPTPSPSPSPVARTRRRHRSRLDLAVVRAKETYRVETRGSKLHVEIARIARDGVLLSALSRGDVAGAQAEANSRLRSPLNHLAHVTRISVIRGSRVLVNATVNSDGVFVVAPGERALRLHGRQLGTLLVSIQDLTGFVKLVKDLTGANVVVRGAGSGRVRTTLHAAAHAHLPSSGRVTIAGRRYAVRSFSQIGWGNEPSAGERLTVWVLAGA